MKTKLLTKPFFFFLSLFLIAGTFAQSNATESSSFFIFDNAPSPCNPATNLQVNYTPECNAHLTWTAPSKQLRAYEGWIQKCFDDQFFTLVEDCPNDMTGTIRFLPSDLAAIGIESGQIITKVLIGIGTHLETISLMELKIWEGGTSLTDPGIPIVNQPITNFASFNTKAWNEVSLTVPFVIDATKELRIGYRVVGAGDPNFAFDAGPGVLNGNIFYISSLGWVNLNNYIIGGSFNLRFKAYVTTPNEEEKLYNIYRDNIPIKENYPLTSFIDYNFSPVAPHTWSVKVACPGGESEPVSISKPPCTVPSYTVSVLANPETGGTVSGNGTFKQGETVTVTTTPNTGFSFINWTKEGTEVSTQLEYNFTITENVVLVANFELTTCTVSVQANPVQGGIVFGNGTYKYGEGATIMASAHADYLFLHWKDGDNILTTNEVYSFTVTKDITFTAVFVLKNSVQDFEKKQCFTIYPNPANGELRITNYELRDGVIEIFDVYGRKQVAESRRQKAEGEVVINISNLSSGVYYIRVSNGQDSYSRCFVKE